MVVTVSVAVCAVAPLISTEEGVTVQVAGLVAPLGPLGMQLRLTVPVRPLTGVTVMMEVLPVVAPAVTVMLPPLVSVKPGTGGAETVAVTVVVWVTVPAVPVTFTL